MKLSNIIKNLKCDKIINYMDHNIECMTHLSTDVIDNSIFFCINGSKADGLDYINEAIQNGAKVIVSDRDVDIDQNHFQL